MKITLLGTGNPAPSLNRMGSGYLVKIADDIIVIDHGPGSHHRLLQTGTKATGVTPIMFSHLHYDHCVDFPRLLLTRWDHAVGQIPDLKVYLQRHPRVNRINWAGDFIKPEKAVIRARNAGAGQINDMRRDGFESSSEMVP